MSVDTLTLARELRAAEFQPLQAEALAAAIGRVVEATPAAADFSRIEARINAVLAAVNVQADSLKAEVKVEIAGLRTELKAEMSGLRGELKAEMRATVETVSSRIESARSSLLTWIVSVIIAGIGLAIALIRH